MDSQVRVASLDALDEFRATYAKFGTAARNALIAADLEIRRMIDWLETDQKAYWNAEVRRREEKLNELEAALHRKRITAAFGNTASDSEELQQVRKAQARRREAEERLKVLKQWVLLIEQEVTEYRGPTQQLGNLLDADVPRALTSLGRMHEILESYLAIAPVDSAAALTDLVGSAAAAAFAPPAASGDAKLPTTAATNSKHEADAANEGIEPAAPVPDDEREAEA